MTTYLSLHIHLSSIYYFRKQEHGACAWSLSSPNTRCPWNKCKIEIEIFSTFFPSHSLYWKVVLHAHLFGHQLYCLILRGNPKMHIWTIGQSSCQHMFYFWSCWQLRGELLEHTSFFISHIILCIARSESKKIIYVSVICKFTRILHMMTYNSCFFENFPNLLWPSKLQHHEWEILYLWKSMSTIC